jgi:hypothetical protein
MSMLTLAFSILIVFLVFFAFEIGSCFNAAVKVYFLRKFCRGKVAVYDQDPVFSAPAGVQHQAGQKFVYTKCFFPIEATPGCFCYAVMLEYPVPRYVDIYFPGFSWLPYLLPGHGLCSQLS